MFQALLKSTETKNKVLFTLGILFLITIFSNIPIISINRDYLAQWLEQDAINNFYFFKLMGGQSFATMSIFALGVSPYITTSIILQLVEIIYKPLADLKKEGKVGQKQYEKYTYIGTFIITTIQSIGMGFYFSNSGLIKDGTGNLLITIVSMIIGCAILVVLGKVIDKKGIGNGISLILMFNIISSFPDDVIGLYVTHIKDQATLHMTLAIVISLIVIIGLYLAIVVMNSTEKKIPVTYANKAAGRKTTRTQNSFIPLKLNMTGVIPVIFAATLFQGMTMLFGLFDNDVCNAISMVFNTNQWFSLENPVYTLGAVFYIFLIIFFSYFYNNIQFNVVEVANNLKKNGGMVRGIRPGKETELYLARKVKYLILIGAVYMSIIVLIPMIIASAASLPSLSFGSTSLIIVVGVIVETFKKIDASLANYTKLPNKLF